MGLLNETAIFLGTAIVSVPIFRRFGFGSVLGYLAAGAVIGPWGLGLIAGVENILHFAELGVVFLLFVIGLELQPSRLWVLRKQVFGLGLSQVLVTGAVLAGGAYLLNLPGKTAWFVGLALALSSTAFVLQMLAEKKQLTTGYGRSAFSVLLFQDLAVIPFLALLPLLGAPAESESASDLPLRLLHTVVVLVGFVVGGRYLLRHVFRGIARWGSEETFTAAALLVVIGAALLMEWAELSMGLGAFLAGMLLADSEYRHQLEADIAPFKGLLLGLFFIAVGMAANMGLLVDRFGTVAALTLGLLVIKFIVVFALARLFGARAYAARNLAFVLPQGGEFAFVLFSAGISYQVIDRPLADLLIVVVTLSMALTPLLYIFNERLVSRWLNTEKPREPDVIDEHNSLVVIAGFGRVGQIVGRILQMRRIPFTAIDPSVEQVDFVRKFGNKVYYGEPSRLEILRAAKVEAAKIFVLAVDDIEASLKTARMVKQHFPDVEIYARAVARHHALQLMDLGVKYFIRETLLSSLEMAQAVLQGLGDDDAQAAEAVRMFKRFDRELLDRQQAILHDEAGLIQSATEAREELQSLFESDVEESAGVER